MYLIAIILPPLAMLMKGRPIQALFCLLLQVTVIGWPIAAIWAIGVVNAANADRRVNRQTRKLERAIKKTEQPKP